MAQTQTGSFRLFRVAGINVYLHWSWLLLAYILIVLRPFGDDFNHTTSLWVVLECLTVLGIVLLHEFGHALACRSVGGVADRIVLWPLGGIAYVAPPPRPGPTLWSIAAGPLVNLLLVPATLLALLVAFGWKAEWPDVYKYVVIITFANLLQLLFNLLPIYPLDGGQILQSILWIFLGRGRSLLIVSGIGILAAVALMALVINHYRAGNEFMWVLLLVAAFVCLRSFIGFQQARFMLDRMILPRHADAACPACGEAPPEGEFWPCERCGTWFDVFARQGVCPHCDTPQGNISCTECQWCHPLEAWRKTVAAGESRPNP